MSTQIAEAQVTSFDYWISAETQQAIHARQLDHATPYGCRFVADLPVAPGSQEQAPHDVQVVYFHGAFSLFILPVGYAPKTRSQRQPGEERWQYRLALRGLYAGQLDGIFDQLIGGAC